MWLGIAFAVPLGALGFYAPAVRCICALRTKIRHLSTILFPSGLRVLLDSIGVVLLDHERFVPHSRISPFVRHPNCTTRYGFRRFKMERNESETRIHEERASTDAPESIDVNSHTRGRK
jgi:hypothetical protein